MLSLPTVLCRLFSLFLLVVASYVAAYDPPALYLTWQHNPSTTMTICWVTTFDHAEDTVDYQMASGGQTWRQTTGTHTQLPQDTLYFIHTAELTHLEPATTYLFRIGQDGPTYKFQTMPLTLNRPIRFAAGGDVYHDGIDLVRETNRQAAKMNPDFALVGGDIAYAAGRPTGMTPSWWSSLTDHSVTQNFSRWMAWLVTWKQEMVTPEGRLIPMLPVLGNHDVSGGFDKSPSAAPFFYALFPQPGENGYNVVDFGNYMSLFLLDSGHTHPVDGAQQSWLEGALQKRETVANKFALYHVPAYPSYRPFDNKKSQQIRAAWVPLFEKYHLTAAFENHDHDYKRTYPILAGKVDEGGVRYFGDGAWGVAKPREASNVTKKWYLAKTAPVRHFLFVTIAPDGTKSVAGISSNGTVIDETSWK